MSRIKKIEIQNFRGVQQLSWMPSRGINCLIGSGDSGKSTILDAIDLCLGARRNVSFADTDFYRLDVSQPISITLTLGELEEPLRSIEVYGPFLRGFNATTGEIEDEPSKTTDTVLTLNLTVEGDLEPAWTLVSDRSAALGITRNLAWKDRVLIAPTRIGALADYNLGWQRGSVLNRISDERADASQALVVAARNARVAFGDQAEYQLSAALGMVETTAREMGIQVGTKVKALLDSQSVSFSGGTISLHDDGGVPLRGLGVGSTRLLIAGLQHKAASRASVVLVDELEYGLEPHRITRFLGSLGAKEVEPSLQAFVTTHSPVALRELSSAQLFVVRQVEGRHEIRPVGMSDDVQSTVRLYPEALLAPSIIICEGASEIGLLRGIDLFAADQQGVPLAAHGVALVDSGGGSADRPYQRAAVFQYLGYRVMVVRDDDISPTPAVEQAFKDAGGAVVAWGHGRALEDELFACLPPSACDALILYAAELHGDLVASHICTASNNVTSLEAIRAEVAAGTLSAEKRAFLGKASRIRKAGWFKSISWMETAARHIVAPCFESCHAEFQTRINTIFGWASDGRR